MHRFTSTVVTRSLSSRQMPKTVSNVASRYVGLNRPRFNGFASSATPSAFTPDDSSNTQVDGWIPDASKLPDFSNTTELVQSAGNSLDTAVVALGYSPTDLAIQYFDMCHNLLGDPWWLSIVAGTVFVRALMLPVVIKGRREAEKMKVIKPDLDKLMENLSLTTPGEVAEFKKKRTLLFSKHDFNPLASIVPAFVQLPVFVSFYFAITAIPDTVPVIAAAWKTGGASWFTDLSSVDPTFVLPVINGLTTVAAMRLGSAEMSEDMAANLRMAAIPLGLVMLGVSSKMSSAILVYWITSNMVSIGQAGLFQIPSVKSKLFPSHAQQLVQTIVYAKDHDFGPSKDLATGPSLPKMNKKSSFRTGRKSRQDRKRHTRK